MRPINALDSGDDYQLQDDEELGPDGLPIDPNGGGGGGDQPIDPGGWDPGRGELGPPVEDPTDGGRYVEPTHPAGGRRPPSYSLGAWDPTKMTIGQFAAGGQSNEGFPEQFAAPDRRNPNAFSYAGFQAPQRTQGAFQAPGQTAGAFKPPSVEEALNDPGLQARLKLGTQSLMYSKAAQGLTNDTGTMNALQDYGQGLAMQGYGDVWNRDFSAWQANAGRDDAAFGRDLATYQVNAGRDDTAFGQALTGYNTNRGNAMDSYTSGRSLDDADYANAWTRYQDDYKIFTDTQDRNFDKEFRYAQA